MKFKADFEPRDFVVVCNKGDDEGIATYMSEFKGLFSRSYDLPRRQDWGLVSRQGIFSSSRIGREALREYWQGYRGQTEGR